MDNDNRNTSWTPPAAAARGAPPPRRPRGAAPAARGRPIDTPEARRRQCRQRDRGRRAKMRGFASGPSRSFRAWLKTLARHALSDFFDARGQVAAGGSRAVELLHAAEAREDLVGRLEAEFDQEVYEEALARVRARVT